MITIYIVQFSKVYVNLLDLDFSQRNPLQTIAPSQSLAELLALLVRYHRVSVVDPDYKVQNYITQSDVIKFVYTNKDLIGHLGGKTIEELKLAKKHVIVVHDYDLVVEALKTIAVEGISAVGVVNKEGTLVGEINEHNMRESNPEGNIIDKLMIPVKDYLHITHNQREVITLPSTTTLLTAIETLEKYHLHRIWIVDNGNLTSVISLGDVFSVLLQ